MPANRYILWTVLVVLPFLAKPNENDPDPFIEGVKQKVQDTSSEYFYPRLIDKFNSRPSSVTRDDYFYLYYGQIFENGNNGMGYMFMPGIAPFLKAVGKHDCKRVIKNGLPLLQLHPFDLTILVHTVLCMKETGYIDTAEHVVDRYELITSAILQTGDGRSLATAIKIVSIPDENIIKGKLGFLGGTDQLLFENDKVYNVWTKGESKIYFQELYRTK